jgi:hypothetical protein
MAEFEFQGREPEVTTPRNWSGGQTQGLGGGMQGRIWNHDRHPIHVIYNNTDPGMGLIVHEPGVPGEVLDEHHVHVKDPTDYKMQKRAVGLMRDWKQYVTVPSRLKNDTGSDVGFVFGDSFGGGSGDLDF